MTARSGDPGVSPESSSAAAAASGAEIWGTSEDLLLACAVSRHGTASWDTVAKEMQSRCPSAAGFTPASCRLRFRVLHRRFSAAAGGGVTAENEDAGGEEEPDAAAVAGWVEELRKLRVAELRREVEKYDLSIGSLQSKVKRLTEERERSLSGETKPPAAKEEEDDVRKGSPEEAGAVEDRVSGHESGRSCKESNSSDLKRPENDPAAAADYRETGEKEAAAAAGEVAVKEEASGESVAGSKETDAEKESSDVQSSASPSRRRQRKGSGGGEEAEAEEASPSVSVPLPAAEAEPLVAFLESIRTSKAGAVFERPLESQEGERYSGTIRRHVDLEMVRSKLVGGAASAATTCYYASASEFYRDLLLLCANALVFFPRGSPEHAAALQVRALVSRQISKDRPPAGQPPGKAPAAAEAKKPKADADIAGPLLEKAPIIVCRKRSSIAKAAAAAAKGEKAEKAETDKKENGGEEKKAAVAAAATTKDKKARGMRTNKSRGPARNQKTAKVSESGEGTKKSDKKGGGGGSSAAVAGGVAKKRNAVDFLNRMNQNGSPSTERVSLLETMKLSAATDQQKKSSSSGKGDGRKEAGGSGSKKGAAASTPPGRRIGRPPKRAAAPPTPPPSKRAKDDKPTRKRGKK